MADSAPAFVTLPEAARLLGLNVTVLRRAVHRGQLPAFDLGTKWPRIARDDLLQWIKSTRVSPKRLGGDCA